ncbi:hypothetical protein evm_008610 [Chilo suppressalis]|nr:hypothetical protein evm_008610 [Chilo suppressalis]
MQTRKILPLIAIRSTHNAETFGPFSPDNTLEESATVATDGSTSVTNQEIRSQGREFYKSTAVTAVTGSPGATKHKRKSWEKPASLETRIKSQLEDLAVDLDEQLTQRESFEDGYYSFYDECKRRYNIKLWKTFTDCFNCLPIAAIIDEKIFCCHGGLSPDLQGMEQIRRIMRPTDVPDTGLLCDLLWSDPDKDVQGWGENDRGVSFTFGPDVVSKFLNRHDLDLICRAHQVVEDGYEFFAKRQLVTLFSAPNYCGEFDNAGGMMSVDETLMCSFQILKPSEKKAKYQYNGINSGRPATPQRSPPKKK